MEQAIDQQEPGLPEARYHLGRVLYESKQDLARAVSELHLVTESEPNNVRAQYYLGQAIRTLVEQEIMVEAEKALISYLDAGAPLGREDEVREFLQTRKADKKDDSGPANPRFALLD